MSCDAHVHLGTRETASPYFLRLIEERFTTDEVSRLLSVDGMLAELDLASIDRAFVVPMAFEGPLIPAANDVIANACRAHSDRLFGFGTVDVRDPKAAIAGIDRLLESGLVGLKLHPAFQQFDPADPRIFPVFERAQEVGMPILVHTGVSTRFFSDRLCRPMALDDALCTFSDLVLILAHGGRLWHEEAAMILRKHPNTYVDISANVANDGSSFLLRRLLVLVKAWTGDLGRVLFGTDYPTYTASRTRAVLEACTGESGVDDLALDGDDAELILGNADTLTERMGWR